MKGGMGGWRDDDLESFEVELERHELSPEGIAETNRHLVERQALFRRAADVATTALAGFDEVVAIVLFGSVGNPLWKEVPRFRSYRRAGIALWHECADVDIAVWLNRLDRLREMRRNVNRALPVILEDTGYGVASHQLDIFVLEPGTDRYLGRMCQFKACRRLNPTAWSRDAARPRFSSSIRGSCCIPMHSARRARSNCSTAPPARAVAPSICRTRRRTKSISGRAGESRGQRDAARSSVGSDHGGCGGTQTWRQGQFPVRPKPFPVRAK